MSGLRYTDGTTTLVIHDPTIGIYRQVKYVPVQPDYSTVEFADPLVDGGEIPVTVLKNVTETPVATYNGTSAQCKQFLRDLNKMFDQARTYQRERSGPKVYMEFRALDTDAWMQSEILNAKISLDEEILDAHTLLAGEIQLEIHHTRR